VSGPSLPDGFRIARYRSHERDAAAVIDLLGRLSVIPSFVPGANFGDFAWNAWRELEPPVTQWLWTVRDRGGSVIGLTWIEDRGEFSLTLDPACVQYDEALRAMTAYAESEWRDSRGRSGEIGTTILAGDQVVTRILTEAGFANSGIVRHHTFRRWLTGAVDVPKLADGFRFVQIGSDRLVAERSVAQLAVWPESSAQEAFLRRAHRSPLYCPELDLAVEAPDGRVAAFLTGWMVDAWRAAQFEPIGARAEFRRMGITKALVLEAVRRATAMGLAVAYINCGADNAAGNALYSSAGLDLAGQWIWWSKGQV
jgi:ribosomal protein S18 acetylase RimI-like enzyme